jgi:site-specific DNA recombinase
MKTVRCAIYTRKSSEEGLEQGFNSLDAQREACAAYILSQASEGWTALPDLYDDGGISGGTLMRPALQRLLADVAAGKVDVIVVYKVDRLSRSLFDFAKLVEAFEKAGTSFVSITQSFNTTSSMGRLTLNMLLSFAQFEREVTAERIRDKIAASKAKGMWMGGLPPLGYRPEGRSLAIVEDHAVLVRQIYRRYLEARDVSLLADQLEADRILMPERLLGTGKTIGGGPFTRGQLYKLLNRKVYVGETQHYKETFPALHEPIIDRALWDEVQSAMAEQRLGRSREAYHQNRSLLAGKIVDEHGEPLIPTHTSKRRRDGGEGRQRYRYYVSRALHHGGSEAGMRIPAREVEALVTEQLAAAFDDPLKLVAQGQLAALPGDFARMADEAARIAAEIRLKSRVRIGELVSCVRVLPTSVEVHCDSLAIATAFGVTPPDHAPPLILSAPVRLTRSGMAMRLIQGGAHVAAAPDRSLVRLIVQARGLWLELRQGERDITELAAAVKLSPSYITRVLKLAFLSPALVEAILAGKQPAGMTAVSLVQTGAIPSLWSEQAAFGKS